MHLNVFIYFKLMQPLQRFQVSFVATAATKSSYTLKEHTMCRWYHIRYLAVHITFIGGTTFSTDQEPHIIQGPIR